MKAILVIDKPEKCEKCPLYAEYLCDKKARCSITYIPIDSAYANCPLKEVPKEKEVPFADKLMFTTELSKKDMYSIGKAEGWNTCIDEIVGKEKQNGKK